MKTTCNFGSLLLGALIGGAVAYFVASDPKRRAMVQRFMDDLGGSVEEKINEVKDFIARASAAEGF
jgi:hypothetical protein